MNAWSWVVVLAVALPQSGRAEFEADNYPVNFAKCGYIVTPPKGSGGYFYSRDCKTIYVLPAKIGKFKATPSLNESVLKNMCPLFDLHQQQYMQKARLLREANERISELEMTGQNPKELARLEAFSAKLETDLEKITDPFRDIEAGKAAFKMDAATSDDMVRNFYELNLNLVRAEGIKFEPMPIQNGYLTLTEYRPTDKTKFPSALAVYANGIKVKVEGSDQNIYKMKSSMSGQIVLGMAKGCDLYQTKLERLKNNQEVSPELLGQSLISELAPSFSYTYPVMSTVRYKAEIDLVRATQLFFDVQKVKSQFRVSEFSNLLGKGEASDIFKMDIDFQDLADRYTKEEDRLSFLSKMTADVRDRLTQKFLRELESVNLAKFEKETPTEVPNPGTITEPVGTVRTCSGQSFLGIRYQTSCSDQVVTRTIAVNGQLDDVLRKIQDFHIEVQEQVNIRELTLHGQNVVFQ